MNRKYYGLLIVLFGTASPYGYAQPDSVMVERIATTISSQHRLPVLPTKIDSRQDTSLAVQQLFANKRSSGKTYTMVGGCNLIGFIALPAGAPAGVVGLLSIGVGVIKKARFGHRREERLLKAYQAGVPLPKRIQRRLKPTYLG
ncbi:hypothetical protein [Spirosoma panaciterrae]|uniref:hypothetical protein n=1 Tax=Spirosoma panaciterrae TaxID=496058 RepID=UPI00036CA046|nr:hypothetical protein [Spirosoma panaciterrae]